MLFALILDYEVIDNKRELYWSPFVLPKARDKLTLMLAALVEACFE